MPIEFGREICGDHAAAEAREWLVTNNLGSYASGTVAGLLTRRYHGLLIAALEPPLGRTLLVTKVDDTAVYDGQRYDLFANRWVGDLIIPAGYWHIERFHVEGTIPVWTFACADALLEKRIWMQPDANTTYVYYTLRRATQALTLSIKALVNYRDHHGNTHTGNWQMQIEPVVQGMCVMAFPGAVPFYLLTDSGEASPAHVWYRGYELAAERVRGLDDHEDHLYAASFEATLEPGGSFTFVASTVEQPALNGSAALAARRAYEQELLQHWYATHPSKAQKTPDWIEQLVLAADQFIVNRPVPGDSAGKTVIAGYHWFGDWGRDTMISLPGLTLATGRPEIARSILHTFARYVDQGMVPNRFPDDGSPPEEREYNTVDATLWYIEAIRAYYAATQDDDLLQALFPVLSEIIDWHRRGTRFNIHLDPDDGLIYAGQPGVQLTWMDAKIGDKVITPRIGKPVEINALWYNALHTVAHIAQVIGQPHQDYASMVAQTRQGFTRFWNQRVGYCFDVLDGPDGHDAALRPNQLFAISLSESPLTLEQQRSIVEICARRLLTSHGLRSLDPEDPAYRGEYVGDLYQRDTAYHQGTVWGWLIGPFIQAHLRVFNDLAVVRSFLEPMERHLLAAGLGTISEIFDGDPPMQPQGCIAQAWSVAEVLRAWLACSGE